MRNAFANEITCLAAYDEKVVLLSGDIGNRLFNDYKASQPERFLNCGAAEANMMSMAAGMALSGLKPVVYTIVPFVTTRCLEQIRVDVCYQNVPVIIVGVGSGLSYASLGATHHSCEDIAFLRVLPNMAVVCPGDVWEVRAALKAAFEWNGPVYIRIGKKNEPVVHKSEPDFQIGKGISVLEGEDICLLSTGNMLPTAVQAAACLVNRQVSAKVVSFHTVKPLDNSLLEEVFSKFDLVVTLEEHSLLAGLGGSIAEWMADQGQRRARLLRFGTPDAFLHVAGNQEYARSYLGLTAEKISDKIVSVFKKNSEYSFRSLPVDEMSF